MNPWTVADLSSTKVYVILWSKRSPYLTSGEITRLGQSNKILWLVEGSPAAPIDVVAHPAGQSLPRVAIGTFATGLPSTVDLPFPGCWIFDVATGEVRREIGLMVGS